MAVEIIGTGRAVPDRKVTNQELAGRIDTSDEWIRSHTGIGARHIADENTASSDLGAAAGLQALSWAIEKGAVAELTPAELALTVDVLIVGSTTQDYYGCPATACIVQNKLGVKNAAAMDITVACSSFICGLEIAAALLNTEPRRRRALVIGAEVLSKITNWEDRSTCILFGDGAGAVLLEKTPDNPGTAGNVGRGLLRTILGADGSGWENLFVPRGGTRAPWKKGETVDDGATVVMNGQAVYNFAVGAITDTIAKMMEEEHLEIDDLKCIVPHQANARIVQAAGKRLKIPEEKFYLNLEEYANTSSASIPIALDELNRSGALQKGDLVMTVGFGAGLTYGGNLIRW
ncbi:MAG: ketoacyl-ACP synthase III [Spirochaetaceae bacterium]|jgi:3-oxoacyl-[acyl-carrier-protein] synthase-3|nr:ketoacyl-ACP synthase III [Spirochaetaceae bacterium]